MKILIVDDEKIIWKNLKCIFHDFYRKRRIFLLLTMQQKH